MIAKNGHVPHLGKVYQDTDNGRKQLTLLYIL